MLNEEGAQMDKAKNKELDQWVKHSVFTIARRTGIPEHRIMSMRWVLTWKDVAPEDQDEDCMDGRKAKARLS